MPYVNDLSYVTKKHYLSIAFSIFSSICVFSISILQDQDYNGKFVTIRKLSKRDGIFTPNNYKNNKSLFKTLTNFNVYENTEYSCSVYVY